MGAPAHRRSTRSLIDDDDGQHHHPTQWAPAAASLGRSFSNAVLLSALGNAASAEMLIGHVLNADFRDPLGLLE